MPLMLHNLTPLDGTTIESLRRVDPAGLSEGAAFLLNAALTGEKPKPADKGFYTVHVADSKGYRFECLYHDQVVQYKRRRRQVGHIQDIAAELADAVQVQPGDETLLDIEALSMVVKKRVPKPVVRHTYQQQVERFQEAIRRFHAKNGYAPTAGEVAKEVNMMRASTTRLLQRMAADGHVLHDGPRTLRVPGDGDASPVQPKVKRPVGRPRKQPAA